MKNKKVYYIAGAVLLLIAGANFANAAMQNNQKKQGEEKDKGFFRIM